MKPSMYLIDSLSPWLNASVSRTVISLISSLFSFTIIIEQNLGSERFGMGFVFNAKQIWIFRYKLFQPYY